MEVSMKQCVIQQLKALGGVRGSVGAWLRAAISVGQSPWPGAASSSTWHIAGTAQDSAGSRLGLGSLALCPVP